MKPGRLGDYFAEVLLLDRGKRTGPTAWAGLGWHSSHPLLVDEFRRGSYLT
jgi:hypothetical protein